MIWIRCYGGNLTQSLKYNRGYRFLVKFQAAPKFGQDTRPSNVTDARSSDGAANACPIVVVGRGRIEVLHIATRGSSGPRRFCTSCLLVIGYFTFGCTLFACLLTTCVLVLTGWTDGTLAATCTVAIFSRKFTKFTTLTSCTAYVI